MPVVGVDAGHSDGLLERAHDGSPAGVKSITQFVSHVSPSSSENACSQRGSDVVTPDQVNRTRMGRPSNVSAPSKIPVSPEKEPITGGSSSPGRRLSVH